MKHLNFYENLKEAQMRLRGTVVCYDGVPYSVMAICAHKPDGIFRVYLDPIGKEGYSNRPDVGNYNPEDVALGAYLDKWMADKKDCDILRKNIDSPLFNKFRPYPLGMCNYGTGVYYVERQPNRKTEQGLIRSMLSASPISLYSESGSLLKSAPGGCPVELYNPQFKACVLSDHPTPAEALLNLNDPKIENTAIAFHRRFALVRGPIGMLFLAYKSDVIGVLPNGDFSVLRIGEGFSHCREVIQDLGLFSTIV